MLLEYDFRVVGAANVDRALSGIEKRFVQHNARVERTFRSAAPRASGGGRVTVDSAARDAIRAERKVTSERERAERFIAGVQRRHFAERQRDEERAAAHAIKTRERAERHVQGVKFRHFAERDREEARQAERGMRQRQRFAERTRGTLGSSVRGALGGVGSMVGGALAIGGGFAATDAIGRNLDLGRRFRQLTIQSAKPGADNPISTDQVRSRVESLAVERGIDREDLTSALEGTVQKTGNLKKGMEDLERFAVLGQAFNATTSDMATAAAVLGEKFGLSGDELADTLATLGAQGRKAAFEFKDMSQLVERLAAAGQRFNFKGKEGVATLGGFTQIARTATGSSEQAATAVEATIRQLIAKAPEIQSGKALGKRVEIFEGGDPTKAARNFQDVIGEVIAASGGDQTKLQKVFGDEGIRGITPLMTAFSSANQQAGGGKAGVAAGRAAIQAMFDEAIEASGTYADAQKDAAKLMEDDSVKMTKALEKIQQAIGKASPAIVRLVEGIASHAKDIERIALKFVEIADLLMNNPFEGLGLIIAAKLTADIASAAIGEVAASAIAKAIGVPATSNAAATGLTAALGGAGGAAIAAAAAAAIALAIAAVPVAMERARKEEIERLKKEAGDPVLLDAETGKAIGSADPNKSADVFGRNVAHAQATELEAQQARADFFADVGMGGGEFGLSGESFFKPAGFADNQANVARTGEAAEAASQTVSQLTGATLEASSAKFAEAVRQFERIGQMLLNINQNSVSTTGASGLNQSNSPTQPR